MNQSNDSKLPGQNIVGQTIDVVDRWKKEFFEAKSFRVWLLVLLVAITLYAYLVPDLNTTLNYQFWPFCELRDRFPWLNNWYGLPPKTVLTFIGLITGSLLFIITLIQIVCNHIGDLTKFIVSTLSLPFKITLPRIVKRYTLEEHTLLSSEPIGQNQDKGYELPIDINEVISVEFEIEIKRAESNHWRAGFEFDNIPHDITTGHFIFHAHEDETEPGILQTRTHYLLNNAVVDDYRERVPSATNPKLFRMSIRRQDGLLRCYINERQIGRDYGVVPNILKKVNIKAWADGKPFEVKFRKIEVVWR